MDRFQDRLLVMKDELYITKDELTAQKEIVRLLRRQLDFATKEKEALYVDWVYLRIRIIRLGFVDGLWSVTQIKMKVSFRF